jgi:hypothetical protein
MHERESLIARIRQLRRVSPDPEKSGRGVSERPDQPRVEALEARVAHLERLVEGLQDSVHRETLRQGRLIAELQEQVEPGAMGAALNKDARDRGL